MQRVLVALFLAATLSACSTAPTAPESVEKPAQAEKHEHTETHEHAEDADKPEQPAESTHACPMHPEITGSEGDDCSSCGMKLTPVAETAPDPEKKDEHKGHSH